MPIRKLPISLPRGPIVNPANALRSTEGGQTFDPNDPTQNPEGTPLPINPLESPPQTQLPLPPDPVVQDQISEITGVPRYVLTTEGFESNPDVQDAIRQLYGDPATALDRLTAQSVLASDLQDQSLAASEAALDTSLIGGELALTADLAGIRAQQQIIDTQQRELGQAYMDRRGSIGLAAYLAKQDAGKVFTDDPLGTVDFGKIQQVTGRTGDELIAAAIADQKTKALDALSTGYVDQVADLRAQEALLASNEFTSYQTYAALEDEVRQKKESLRQTLNGTAVFTGDEARDKTTNQFIDELDRYYRQDVAPEGTPQHSIDAAKRDYIYTVLAKVVGAGSAGQGDGVERLSPDAAIALADQMLNSGEFGELDPVGNALDTENLTPEQQVKEQALNELRLMLGEDLSADIDPTEWNNPNALDLWSNVISYEVVTSKVTQDRIATEAALREEQDRTVAKNKTDEAAAKSQAKIDTAAKSAVDSGQQVSPESPEIPQGLELRTIKGEVPGLSDRFKAIADNNPTGALDGTTYEYLSAADQALIDEYLKKIGGN